MKRDVVVYKEGRRLETLTSRPIRLLPSNAAGVVYAGDVYPLHAGDHIDLGDTPVKKALCTRFVTPGASIPYVGAPGQASKSRKASVQIARWNVESNRFGNYVVFDASPLMAQRFVKALADAALGVRRWDESIRAADDGHFYDYFARLEFDGTREQTMARVRSLLGDTKTAAAAGVVRTFAPASESTSEADILALVELAVEEAFGPKLRDAHAAAQRLQNELDNAKALAQPGRLAMKRVEELEAELSAAIKKSQSKQSQLSARAAEWQNEAKGLRGSNAQLHALLDDAKSRTVSSADPHEQVT